VDENAGSFDPRDVDNVKLGDSKGSKKKRDSYDYGDTVQVINLQHSPLSCRRGDKLG